MLPGALRPGPQPPLPGDVERGRPRRQELAQAPLTPSLAAPVPQVRRPGCGRWEGAAAGREGGEGAGIAGLPAVLGRDRLRPPPAGPLALASRVGGETLPSGAGTEAT